MMNIGIDKQKCFFHLRHSLFHSHTFPLPHFFVLDLIRRNFSFDSVLIQLHRPHISELTYHLLGRLKCHVNAKKRHVLIDKRIISLIWIISVYSHEAHLGRGEGRGIFDCRYFTKT